MNKQIIGVLALIVLATAVYISMGNEVRLRVDNDKSTFYVKNDNNRWVVSGREYNKLFDGSSRMNRRSSGISVDTLIDNISETVTITRTTPYIRGPTIVDTYEFDGKLDDVELFPIRHIIEVYNASGKFFRYEVKNLVYDGIKYKLQSETELEFGRNMKVELNPGYRWAWVYKSGGVTAQYDIPSDYEVFNVRLFDPVFVGTYPFNVTIINGTNESVWVEADDGININTTLNSTEQWWLDVNAPGLGRNISNSSTSFDYNWTTFVGTMSLNGSDWVLSHDWAVGNDTLGPFSYAGPPDPEQVSVAFMSGNNFSFTYCDENLNDQIVVVLSTDGTQIFNDTPTATLTLCGQHNVRTQDITAVNSSTFVIIYYDGSPSSKLVMDSYNVDGTKLVTRQTIANSGGTNGVTAAAFNSTHVVFGYHNKDPHPDNISFSIYTTDGTLVLQKDIAKLDYGVGKAHATVDTYNSTDFVIAYTNNSEPQIGFNSYDVDGNAANADMQIIDSGVSTDIDVGTFNATTFVLSWVDKTSNNVSFAIYNRDGTSVVGVTAINSSTGLANFTRISIINESLFTIAWQNYDEGSLWYAMYNVDGSSHLAPTKIADSTFAGGADITNVTGTDIIALWITDVNTILWNGFDGAGLKWLMSYGINLKIDKYAVIKNAFWNLTGLENNGWPTDITVDADINTAAFDLETIGELRGDILVINEFNDSTNSIEVENITNFVYLKVGSGNLTSNFTFNVTGGGGEVKVISNEKHSGGLTSWTGPWSAYQTFNVTSNIDVTKVRIYSKFDQGPTVIIWNISTDYAVGPDNITIHNQMDNNSFTGGFGFYVWTTYPMNLNPTLALVDNPFMLEVIYPDGGADDAIGYSLGDEYALGKLYNGTFAEQVDADMEFRIYADTNPNSVYVDAGNDGIDWNTTTTFSTTVDINISAADVNSYLALNCPTPCEYPIVITLDGGKLTVSDPSLNQSFSSIDYASSLNSALSSCAATDGYSTVCTLPIEVNTSANGTIRISGVNITYVGKANYSVISHNADYSVNSSMRLIVTESNFSITYPDKVGFWGVYPSSNNAKNVTPYGQSDSIAIWNLTSLAYNWDVNYTIKLAYNLTNITIAGSTTENRTQGADFFDSPWRFASNVAARAVTRMWHWVDLYSVNTTQFRRLGNATQLFQIEAKCEECL